MLMMSRDIVVFIRILLSGITAGFTVFFVSSLAGQDLIRSNETIRKLDGLRAEISKQLDVEINHRVKQLGEVPEIDPYRRFYCVELAKEIHDISYLPEKFNILFDTYDVRAFEGKMKALLRFTDASDVASLLDELEIVKRELKNTINLIDKKRENLVRQRTSFIALFVILWILLYLYYSRGSLFHKQGD